MHRVRGAFRRTPMRRRLPGRLHSAQSGLSRDQRSAAAEVFAPDGGKAKYLKVGVKPETEAKKQTGRTRTGASPSLSLGSPGPEIRCDRCAGVCPNSADYFWQAGQ